MQSKQAERQKAPFAAMANLRHAVTTIRGDFLSR
jgi:hypothetical protein